MTHFVAKKSLVAKKMFRRLITVLLVLLVLYRPSLEDFIVAVHVKEKAQWNLTPHMPQVRARDCLQQNWIIATRVLVNNQAFVGLLRHVWLPVPSWLEWNDQLLVKCKFRGIHMGDRCLCLPSYSGGSVHACKRVAKFQSLASMLPKQVSVHLPDWFKWVGFLDVILAAILINYLAWLVVPD